MNNNPIESLTLTFDDPRKLGKTKIAQPLSANGKPMTDGAD